MKNAIFLLIRSTKRFLLHSVCYSDFRGFSIFSNFFPKFSEMMVNNIKEEDIEKQFDEVFTSERPTQQHVQTVHTPKIVFNSKGGPVRIEPKQRARKVIECQKCKKTFKNNQVLKQHQRAMHEAPVFSRW